REPAAPTRLYTDMRACLRASFDGEATALDECLRAVPDAEDTHPTLRQRLEAIGARSRLPEGFSKSAAEAWLGPLEPVLGQAFSERWRHHNPSTWAIRHEQGEVARSRLAVLSSRAEAGALAGEEWYEFAELSAQLTD